MDLNKASEPGTGNRLAEPSAGLDPGGGGGSAGSRRSSSNRTTEYCLEHRKSATDTAVLKSGGSEMVATAGADGDVKVGTTGPPPLKSPVSLGCKRSFFKFPLLFERASQTWCVLTTFFSFPKKMNCKIADFVAGGTPSSTHSFWKSSIGSPRSHGPPSGSNSV